MIKYAYARKIEEFQSVGRKSLIAVSVFFFFGLYGCQPQGENPSLGPDSFMAAESGNLFPEFLVGTWKADRDKWILTFEPDGSISSFRHFFGMEMSVSEGGLSEEWRNGAIATYVLGPCEAVYLPETRQLDVKIVVDFFLVGSPSNQMNGNFVDYLKGPVSHDGEQWEVNWLSYCKIEGAKLLDPNKIQPKPLIFTKILNEVKDKDQ